MSQLPLKVKVRSQMDGKEAIGRAKPCANFQKGLCTYGSACHFSHVEVPASLSSTHESKKPCANYQKGTCTYGADCHFLHTSTSETSSAAFPQKVCANYSSGDCAHGERCHYVHEGRTTPKTEPTKPCANFQKGLCTYGSACHFLHPVEVPDSLGIKSKKPCANYQKGTCTYGSACHFLHTSTSETSSAAFPRKVCANYSSGGCAHGERCHYVHEGRTGASSTTPNEPTQPCANFQKGLCTYGSACHFSHVEVPASLSSMHESKKPCANYQKGTCTYGADCHFLHTSTSEISSAAFPRKVCANYSSGDCAHGERCHYVHEGRTGASSTTPNEPTQPCANFQKGLCTYGSACRFSHHTTTDAPHREPCKDFLSGKCSFGANCHFTHTPCHRYRQGLCTSTPCDAVHTYDVKPLLQHRAQLLDKLKKHRVVVVLGCEVGKTYELPQYVAGDAGFHQGPVLCTQQTDADAISSSSKVQRAFSPDTPGLVGCDVAASPASPGNRIIYMTEAQLINRFASGHLTNASCVIVDDAHRRTMCTDIVLGECRLRLQQQQDFHVVIAASGATEADVFVKYFSVDKNAVVHIGKAAQSRLQYAVCEEGLSAEEHLVEELMSRLEKESNHTVVFLSGDKAIRSAISAAKNHPKWCDDRYEALPLHGDMGSDAFDSVLQYEERHSYTAFDPDSHQFKTLPKHSQERLRSQKRMVLFCTSIAEATVTVPNVGLVVDSGLVKRSRFDTRKTATVLEVTHLTPESAELRARCAAAFGCCVRLYCREDVRPSAGMLQGETETLCLQIASLGHSPVPGHEGAFPYLPGASPVGSTEESMGFLKCIKCVDEEGKVTPKGAVFASLAYSPRFLEMVDRLRKDGHMQLGAVVLGLAHLEYSIFSNKGDKCEHASRATEYVSDLLLAHSVFCEWVRKGDNQYQHAASHHLNHKSLKTLHKIVDTVTSAFSTSETNGTLALPDSHKGAVESLSLALLETMPERLCEMRVPHDPSCGVTVVCRGQLARVDGVSALAVASSDAPATHAISLRITESDTCTVVNQLHPILPEHIRSAAPHMFAKLQNYVSAAEYHNVGPFAAFQPGTHPWTSNGPCPLALPQYEAAQRTLIIRAPEATSSLVTSWTDTLLQNCKANELAATKDVCLTEHSLCISYKAGLHVSAITDTSQCTALRVRRGDNVKFDGRGLDRFLRDHNLREGFVEHRTSQHDGDKFFLNALVYKSAEAAEKAASRLGEENVEGRFTATVGGDVGVTLKFPYTAAVRPIAVEGLYELSLDRLSEMQADKLSSWLQERGLNPRYSPFYGNGKMSPHPQRLRVRGLGRAQFSCLLEERAASVFLPWQSSSRSSRTMVRPTMEVTFTCKCDIATATQLRSQHSTSRAQYTASVHKVFASRDLKFMDNVKGQLAKVAQETAKADDASCSTTELDKAFKVTIESRHPSACKRVLRKLAKAVEVNVIDLRPKGMKQLLQALDRKGALQAEASSCGVRVPSFEDVHKHHMPVYGSDVNYGRFLARLGTLFNEFSKGWKCITLDKTALSVLGSLAGKKFLQETRTQHSVEAALHRHEQILTIYGAPEGADAAESAVQAHLQEHSGDVVEGDSKCMKCGSQSHTEPLTLCGHKMCDDCVASGLETCPVPECGSSFVASDVSGIKRDQSLIASTVLRRYLKQRMHPTYGVCCGPAHSDCDAVLKKSDQHHMCWMCCTRVCVKCNTADPDHRKRTCAEYEEHLRLTKICSSCGVPHPDQTCAEYKQGKQLLEQVFVAAERFVQAEFPQEYAPFCFHRNTSVAQTHGTGQHPALKKFLASGKVPQHTLQPSLGRFGWHGTRESANLVSICRDGWDPKRRSGQVYGRGEYFAHKAGTSIGGYVGATRTVIVAFMLKGTWLNDTTHLVVDNPLCNTRSYVLPIGVVTYQGASPPAFTPPPIQKQVLPESTPRTLMQQLVGFLGQRKEDTPRSAWEWESDEGWKKFPNAVSSQLEAERMRGTSQVSVSVISEDTKVSKRIHVDLVAMQQKNETTHFTRQVRRVQTLPDKGTAQGWQWQDGTVWSPYSKEAVSKLDIAYSHYAGGGCSTVDLVTSALGGSFQHTVDFQAMTQTNRSTGTERKVRRAS